MISKAAKATLRRASRGSVEETLRRLKSHLDGSKWIGASNRYRVKCTEFLFRDTQPNQVINGRHLAQYIAASGPLHCADGWSVLGRAIDCHGRGDFDASRHLAYYAELRAAFSLLAAEGIGIFDDRHFVLRTPKDCQLIGTMPRPGRRGGLRTHFVAWEALDHWADLKRSTELLGKTISASGLPLIEWLQNFDTGPSFQPIGSKWLKTWGLDLRRLSDDRTARNESSYRPSRLSAKKALTPSAISEFIRSFWTLCEPISESRFELLDRHLIRLTLEEAFAGVTGRRPADDAPGFKAKVDLMLDSLGFENTRRDEWSKFFTRKSDPDDPKPLEAAKLETDIHDTEYHIQVISRAMLLLRVAAGGCSKLLREADIGKDELAFWWKALGRERGLWDSQEGPVELTDLWADVDTAMTGIGEWERQNAGTQASFERWRRERAHEISVLGGCERIALWGLGL